MIVILTTDFKRDINSTVIQTSRWSTNTGANEYRGDRGVPGLWCFELVHMEPSCHVDFWDGGSTLLKIRLRWQ